MKNYIAPIIKELQSTTSRLEKEAILNANKNNQLLRNFFEAAKNPFRTYGIKKIPEYTTNSEFDGMSLEYALTKLDLFESKQVTGGAATKKLLELLTNLSSEDAVLFANVIKGDPDCGVSESILNKVWPNLIPKQIYMGATPMSDEAINNLDFINGVYAQNKEDGLFMSTSIVAGSVKHFGRSGKEYDFLSQFDYLSEVFAGYRLDGEIRMYTDDFSKFEPRKISNGYTNKFQAGKPQKGLDPRKLCYIIWDVVPLADSLRGVCNVPYSKRFNALNGATKKLTSLLATPFAQHDVPLTRIVYTRLLYSVDTAKEMFKEVSRMDEEGVILKNADGVWGHGKPTSQVKLKNVTPAEMKIVGFNEHTKKAGCLGSFMLESADGIIITNCGSGLDDNERKLFWEGRDTMIDNVVSVRFESIISKEGSQTLSLNLPIYDEVRVDKDVANTALEMVQEYEGTKGVKCDQDIYDIIAAYK